MCIRGAGEHHKKVDFQQEFLVFLKKHNLDYDPQHIWGKAPGTEDASAVLTGLAACAHIFPRLKPRAQFSASRRDAAKHELEVVPLPAGVCSDLPRKRIRKFILLSENDERMVDFSRFSHLTFDCYGTLVDWETGILSALRPILATHLPRVPPDEDVLGLYAAIESENESGPYRSYRAVLEQVVRAFGARLGFVPDTAETVSLAESVKDWRPFPDTVDALRRLAGRYQLAVISNVDDELFAATAQRLQVKFVDVITAQQARSYKPSRHNFRLALQRLGAPKERVLHAAQSLYHDIAPAKELGLATAWVNRRKGKGAFGATPAARAAADVEVPDMNSLAELAGV